MKIVHADLTQEYKGPVVVRTFEEFAKLFGKLEPGQYSIPYYVKRVAKQTERVSESLNISFLKGDG